MLDSPSRDERTFAELFAKRPGVIKPGLERIAKGYRALGAPSRHAPTILIGGTNGKGTTSGFLWRLASLGGIRAGLYTSPHLIHFAERVLISGETIDDDLLYDEWQKVRARLPADLYEAMSFFEVTTLMALTLFDERATELNVLEVGLGGRWDATNITDPVASVIVSIGMDHMEFLGRDILAITREKLGIARPGRPLFIGGGTLQDDPSVRRLVEEKAAELETPLFRFGHEFFLERGRLVIRLPDLPVIDMPEPVFLAEAAPFLRHNFALAAAVHHWLTHAQRSFVPVSLERLWQRFASDPTPLPPCMAGRFFRTEAAPANFPARPLVIDVCHNVDGVQAFRAGLGERSRPGLVCILKDKDINAMLDVLRGILSPLVLFKIDSERCLSREDLASRHHDLEVAASFAAAWQWMTTQARESEEPWVVCGSVMAVGKVLEHLSVNPASLSAQSLLARSTDVARARSGADACGRSGE